MEPTPRSGCVRDDAVICRLYDLARSGNTRSRSSRSSTASSWCVRSQPAAARPRACGRRPV